MGKGLRITGLRKYVKNYKDFTGKNVRIFFTGEGIVIKQDDQVLWQFSKDKFYLLKEGQVLLCHWEKERAHLASVHQSATSAPAVCTQRSW